MSDVPGFDYPPGYTAFQFVFVLLQASAFGGVFTGFAMASDFETGLRRRLMLAAPPAARDRGRLLRSSGQARAVDDRRDPVRRSPCSPG